MSDVEEKSVACEVVTHSTEETIACGRTVGGLLEEGDVLVLTGDLGAGKTQFTKGIAAALGVVDDVCSPTFNIQMVYEGERMPLYHFDLYRLDGGEQFLDQLGDDLVRVTLTRLDDEVAPGEEPPRRVAFAACGNRAARLVRTLADEIS